jgi:hypothetical protein
MQAVHAVLDFLRTLKDYAIGALIVSTFEYVFQYNLVDLLKDMILKVLPGGKKSA